MTWLVVKTPAQCNAWDVGDITPDQQADLVVRARVASSFPQGDGWWLDGSSGYELMVTTGEPSPQFGAVVRPRSDLDAVSRAQVTAYVAQQDAAGREARIAAAEKTLADLTDAEVETLIARRTDPGAVGTTRGGR